MALSGTLTGTCDNTNYTLTCEWSATQSIANNTSTITAKVYLKAPSGWSTDSSYWDCTINGTQVTNDKSAVVSSTKVLLGQRSWTVTHNSDGTCSVTISFSYSNGLTSAGTYTTKKGSGSGTIKLDTIPRTSSFTLSSSSLGMGSSQTVTISRASSSFTHTVQYTFGSSTTTVATQSTSTSISFTPPISLASQVPNACSGTCTVKVTTYSGSTSIGSTSKTFTLNVPSSVIPTISVSHVKNNTLGSVCISGKSTVTVNPSGSGSYGSTISSYTYSGAGLSGTGSSKTTGTLNAGSYTVTVTVKDSRGRQASATTSFTVYAYSSPTCTVSAKRTNSSWVASASGTNVQLTLGWSLSNPNNTNSNVKKYTVQYKKKTDSSWTTHTSGATLSSYSSTSTNWNISNVTFATTTSYDIKFTVTDSYGSTSATCTVSTISAIFNIEKSGVGVGKIYERGHLDVAGDIYSTARFISNGNGKNLIMGTGSADVYIHNSNANKYLQLKDDGTLQFSDKMIAIAGVTTKGDLTMTGNITAQGYLWAKGDVWADGQFKLNTTNDNARIGYNSTDKCTYISNDNNNWLRLWDNGTITWRGYNVLTANGSQDISGNLNCGQFSDSFYSISFKRKTSDVGSMLTKVGASYTGGEPCCAIEVGKHDGNSTFTLQRRYRFAISSVTPATDNAVTMGTSGMRWKALYSANGTVQTSDERYKFILENIDDEKCFDLIKNTVLYGYSTLNKRIDTYNSVEEISNELKESSKEDVNLHMGFIAQDVEDNELGKYIIRKDTLIDDNGKSTNECIYGIDNYAYTTAIHGALKHEIAVRENEIETLKQQIRDLQQQVKKISE